MTDDEKLWTRNSSKLVSFRCDRSSENSKKLKGGGVMLLVPKSLSPKLSQDLNILLKKYDSMWIEMKKTHRTKMQEQLC